MTLGERVHALRINRGWTMQQLAKMAGVSPTSIAHYEQDETIPQLDKAVAVARALHTTVEALTGNAEYCRDAEILQLKKENAALKRTLNTLRSRAIQDNTMILEALMPDPNM